MASKSRSRPARKKPGPNPLADLGLFDIPKIDMDANSDDDSEIDENDLESELEQLLHGQLPPKRSKPKNRKAPAVIDIEKMAAACLEDDIVDDNDENLSGDEDLLKELQNISSLENNEPPEQKSISEDKSPTVSKNSSQETSQSSVLTERLALYNEAIIAAKSLNDTSKVRRYGRAVKTLENLLKSAKLGNPINEEDIPPVVSIPKKGMQPSIDPSMNIPDHVIGSSDAEIAGKKHTNNLDDPVMDAKQNVCLEDGDKCAAGFLISGDEKEAKQNAILAILEERKNQYKIAAVQAKKAGNKNLAMEYLRTAKTFASVIEDTTGSRLCDITNIPPPPPGYEDSKNIQTAELTDTKKRTHEQVQTSPIETAALAAAKEEEAAEIFAAPDAPTTVLEALQQRLEKYKTTREEAEASGNSGKVRRLKRIEKSYVTAIKDYTAGKEVDFESLPTPPGFAPIPVKENSRMTASKNEEHLPPKKTATSPKPVSHTSQVESDVPAARKPKIQRTNTAKSDRQLDFLLERQKLFRQAAVSAKQNGDLQQAKEYLRMSKGFDSMIEATKCGLPIDASSIPTPPQLESSDFEIIDVSECIENSDLNQDNLFETLQKDLCNQLEICSRNKEHFFQLGDVSSASKFEKLALQTKKDLIVIQNLKKNFFNEAVPKFHYETRLFSMVLCHTDLADNHFEVTVERGINLPGNPEELDSYVKIEFPIPTDAPQRQKTRTVKDTNNPIFDEVFKFEFQRKSRSHLRLFKRHCLKLEVWSKGGFLRSDNLLGTVSVKLNDLESKCLLHDSYNLMDGRKTCAGKLAVKIRIREPLLVKQVEEVREKWLVIGS